MKGVRRDMLPGYLDEFTSGESVPAIIRWRPSFARSPGSIRCKSNLHQKTGSFRSNKVRQNEANEFSSDIYISSRIHVYSVSDWELVTGHMSYVSQSECKRRFWRSNERYIRTLLLPLDVSSLSRD